MLSSELLVARVRGDTITPAFIPPQGDHLELARDIISIFLDYTGKKLGELNGILEEMEDQGFDYRLVRGMVSLLERRCDFTIDATVEPALARRAAFEAAANAYPVITPEGRQQLLGEVASSLGTSLTDLERSLLADLEDELLINSFRKPSPEELIQQYNLGLAQALLFKATSLRFRTSSGHKEILRKLKWLGLMYDAEQILGRVEITIEGPTSVLKMTERYGTAMAKLLPLVIGTPGWAIEATILRKDFSGNPKLYTFAMKEDTHGSLFRPGWDKPLEFDSSAEEMFYTSFANAATGWTISREPEPLITGKYLFIPDFLLEKDGTKVYVEIAGFWTAEYLKRKIAKLKEVRDQNLMILASDQLACEAFRDIPGVIFFGRKMPMKPVLDRLKTLEKASADAGARRIGGTGLKLDGDVIQIATLAETTGESHEAIRAYLDEHPPAGYITTKDELISDKILAELRTTLPNSMPYGEAVKVIRLRGITSVDAIIQALGYSVKWSGLDPDSATVYRPK
jgi:predicted nuclease of restriction endonuclease-like RecB superfamily